MKIFKIIAFVILSCFVGLCAGMMVGGFVTRNMAGMDGLTKALEYGFAGVVIALVVSLLLARRLTQMWFHRLFITICFLSLVIAGFIAIKMVIGKNKHSTSSTENSFSRTITDTPVYHFAGNFYQGMELPVGTGVAQPHLIPGKPLYFYGYDAVFSKPEQLTPADSVTFKKGQHYIEITTAPPYLVPEVLKLDYDAFYLRVLTVTKNWLEVIVNNTNGQTAWISRDNATFIDWHDFLLNVYAVELIDVNTNPLRIKPLDHAGILATTPPGFQLKPLAVQDDWLMVATNGLADRIPPSGWVRWRDGNKILIRYSILS